jgi:hypothetical protein
LYEPTRTGSAKMRICPGEHHARVRVVTHIKKLDDCFGQFLVRVICDCGAVRAIEPEALAWMVGCKVPLKELALRMRCSRCGKQAAEVVAVAKHRPRGKQKTHISAMTARVLRRYQ